MYLYLLLLS